MVFVLVVERPQKIERKFRVRIGIEMVIGGMRIKDLARILQRLVCFFGGEFCMKSLSSDTSICREGLRDGD